MSQSQFKDRWYQIEGVDAFENYFLSGAKGHPLGVFPTGTGKSVIIAKLIQRLMLRWPTVRCMMITHDMRLIEQNASKFRSIWPECPLGIYSAGLGGRDTLLPVIFGGVKSISLEIQRALAANLSHFGWRDFIFVDEAHLISQKEDSDYHFVIRELMKINPNLRIIGFTATPFRMRQGMVTDNGMFTDIVYDISGVDAFNRLIDEGYLCTLIARPPRNKMDDSQLVIRAGEYTDASQEAAMSEEVLYKACVEVVQTGNDFNRWSWLSFAPSIKRAELINEILTSLGVDSTVVHSQVKGANGRNKDKEIANRIEEFKRGYYRSIVNKDMLTTGFDHPCIDLINMFRKTRSPGLHVQMNGRGTRPYDPQNPGDVDASYFVNPKDYCIVMDFARNVQLLGPINDPVIPRKPGEQGGEAPVRICPEPIEDGNGGWKGKTDIQGRFGCGTQNHSSAPTCVFCGFIFPKKKEEDLRVSHEDVFVAPPSSKVPKSKIEYWNVAQVFYTLHTKAGSAPMIKVIYACSNGKSMSEFVCLEHMGHAAKRAREWWRERQSGDVPLTTAAALAKVSQLRKPASLRVETAEKYPKILSVEW